MAEKDKEKGKGQNSHRKKPYLKPSLVKHGLLPLAGTTLADIVAAEP